jgi:hypothetical protein
MTWAAAMVPTPAEAGAGYNNVARLYDSAGADAFEAAREQATLKFGASAEHLVRADGFRAVHASSDAGGTDNGFPYDSALLDHLKALGNWAQMACTDDNPAENAPYVYELTGFDYKAARPPQNEDDTKEIDPSAADWLVTEGWD